jgi:ADP-ribosylglycohydrolase
MSFVNRCQGAFLGLGLGDAYGRPLEFMTGRLVRDTRVSTLAGDFRWTDDTHMALYLAEAVLSLGPDVLDPDVFGLAVGTQFSRWLDDPLMPSTAPGNTCIAGASAWRRTGDWRTSGVRRSDGCGAVMRIAPLAMALAGDDLTRAAEVQALLTHGHDNAVDASVVGSHLLRWTLESGRFDRELVKRALDIPCRAGMVHEALRAALVVADDDAHWLDEAAIPPGDGGWRAASALGLAVAAALRWGHHFATAVDHAARIDGDSDSVACLAGMFLGAAGGTEVLPSEWVDALPERDRIRGLATRLGERGLPIVAVADLHGRLDLLDALLARIDAEVGECVVVLLGDYCDNGPEVPGLLDRLIALREQRGSRFVSIIGNHDLAVLRVLGFPGEAPDQRWFERMGRYWNGMHAGTPAAYGAADAAGLAARMPREHQRLLRSLPWVHTTGRYVFVHAGMEARSLGPQVASMAAKELPDQHLWLPPQVRDKSLATVGDVGWDRVVVSAHTRQPGGCFEGPNRIGLSGEVDASGVLYAVVLPARRLLAVTLP